MKTKSALSYFGSDSQVASSLAAMLDDCKHVTIPFVGGAAIIPYIKAKAIICNDKYEDAINFYQYLSGWHGENSSKMLVDMCRRTLSHPSRLTEAEDVIQRGDGGLLAAWAFWAVCWIGRKGQGGTTSQGKSCSVRFNADGGNNASRISQAAQDLDEWKDHFKRCEWMCEDFTNVLPKVHDRPDCGIYLDPPWVGAKYVKQFNDDEHRVLCTLLSRFEKSPIVLRYGDDELIRELYPTDSWHWIESESRTQANRTRAEVWITRRAKTGGGA